MTISVTKSEIIKFLESLPEDFFIQLSSDGLTNLLPEKILIEIEKKSKIGKKYYIQLGKEIISRKKTDNWDSNQGNGIII